MFGGTNDNLDEILKVDPKTVAGLKLFLGSSTGNMLVDDPAVIEKIFSSTDMVISVHCEDEATIKKNLEAHIAEYGDDIPMEKHPVIRSEEACYLSSSKAIELAKKTGARLHVFHLSTGKETNLFTNKKLFVFFVTTSMTSEPQYLVNHRRLQRQIMGFDRPTDLLGGILYDMTCLHMRRYTGSKQL